MLKRSDHWKEDYLNSAARISNKEKELLMNGPKSWIQAVAIGTIKTKWQKMNGTYQPPQDPSDLQSSFKEFNSKVVEDAQAYVDDDQ